MRTLGGTLSNATPRKKDLRRIVGTMKMQEALMCPNYKVFQLLTSVSVPEAISKGLLQVIEGGGYRLQQSQDPFSFNPDLYNPDSWKISAQLLGRNRFLFVFLFLLKAPLTLRTHTLNCDTSSKFCD